MLEFNEDIKRKFAKAKASYTKQTEPLWFDQIKQACDFVNSRSAFHCKYGPAVPMLIEYTESLEKQIYEYKQKVERLKQILTEFDE